MNQPVRELARVEKFVATPNDPKARWRKRVLALRADGTIWGRQVTRVRAERNGGFERSRNHGWKLLRIARPEHVANPDDWIELWEARGWKEVEAL